MCACACKLTRGGAARRERTLLFSLISPSVFHPSPYRIPLLSFPPHCLSHFSLFQATLTRYVRVLTRYCRADSDRDLLVAWTTRKVGVRSKQAVVSSEMGLVEGEKKGKRGEGEKECF